MFAKHPSPLKLAWHSFRSMPGSMRITSLAGHLFCHGIEVETDHEHFKGVRQSLRSSKPVAFDDEQNW